MSKKYKKTYKYLNYVENLLILSLTNTGCVSIPVFFYHFVFLFVLQFLE